MNLPAKHSMYVTPESLVARLDELLPPPKFGYEMEMHKVKHRALRILGHDHDHQNRKALTPEQEEILSQFSEWEFIVFQRVCSILSDPDKQDEHQRQWMDRALIGAHLKDGLAMCWMPVDQNSAQVVQINQLRENILTLLITMLHPDLGGDIRYQEHQGMAIADYNQKALVDIKLGYIFDAYNRLYRLNLDLYQPRGARTIEQATERANLNSLTVVRNLLTEIEQKTNEIKTESDPLAVQLLKSTVFNRICANINQLIAQTKEAELSLLPLTEFIFQTGFRLQARHTEEQEDQDFMQLFTNNKAESVVDWRKPNQNRLMRIRSRANKVWEFMNEENLTNSERFKSKEIERRRYSYFLTLIMAWCYCTKTAFKASLRGSKEKNLVSGESQSAKPSIPELRFHNTQLKLLSSIQMFNGRGDAALKALVQHRLIQYEGELALYRKLHSLTLSQLDELYPVSVYKSDHM